MKLIKDMRIIISQRIVCKLAQISTLNEDHLHNICTTCQSVHLDSLVWSKYRSLRTLIQFIVYLLTTCKCIMSAANSDVHLILKLLQNMIKIRSPLVFSVFIATRCYQVLIR